MATPGHVCCSASFCTNYKKKTPHLSFFRFPKDSKRCSVWRSFVKRIDLSDKTAEFLNNNCKLCSVHFERRCFMNELRNKLVWDAIPTLETKPTLEVCEPIELSSEIDNEMIENESPECDIKSVNVEGIHGIAALTSSNRNCTLIVNYSPKKDTISEEDKFLKTVVPQSNDDQYSIFGNFVATELRNFRSENVQRKVKKKIQQLLLDAAEEDEKLFCI